MHNSNKHHQAVRTYLDGSDGEGDPFPVDTPHPWDRTTILHSAVAGMPSLMIEYLIKIGAPVDARNNKGRTPLHIASLNGSVRNMTRLIAYGADVNAKDNEGLSALSIAAHAGHLHAVKFLQQTGDAQLGPSIDGRTPMHLAAIAGRSSPDKKSCMMCRLLNMGSTLDETTASGFTAVHFAAVGNQTGALLHLIELGAETSPRDRHGLTPLMLAAAYGHVSVVDALVSAGAAVGLTDNRGYSLMHFAAEKGHLHIMNYLFAHIPILVRADKHGKRRRPTLGQHMRSIASWPCRDGITTPYTLASRHDHFNIIERLNFALLLERIPQMPEHQLLPVVHSVILLEPSPCNSSSFE